MATPTEAQSSANSPSFGVRERATRFCRSFGLRVPILQAPMAGACPVALAISVANAGGMGGFGALTTSPDGIADWVREFRDQSNGGFQINLWIPDPPPVRDPENEREVREFLAKWGPPVPAQAGDAAPLDFAAQCEALLAAAPPVVSSIMGLFPDKFIAEIKARSTAWFACVTTLAEGRRGRRRGCRRHRCARFGGRRPPRCVRCRRRGASIRRAVRSGAAARGQIVGADHRHGRDR